MKQSFKRTQIPLLLFLILLIHLPVAFAKSKTVLLPGSPMLAKPAALNASFVPLNKSFLYDSLQLDSFGMSRQAFLEGIKGYTYLQKMGKLNKTHILSIVDFSLPSSEKRLFVLDMENLKVLFNTYVAHGRNSGKEFASKFSNKPSSHMSSLGFYITGETYNGEHGLSLKLEGEEKGINDNAESRAIVIHCADYVSEKMIQTLGYIGRSLGCPALPRKYSKPIIETIKEGSCFFMYSPSSKYLARSPLLQLAS